MNKIKTILVIGAALVCAASFAAEEPKFKAGEFTIDLAATYSDAKTKFDDTFDRSAKGGTYGAAIGVAYFFTENIGVGVDGVIPNYRRIERYVVENANVSGILRYPLGSFAPYALGGIGRNFSAGDYTVHAGVGGEWRFTKSVGAFGEARYVWGFRRSPEYVQGRVGVRFAF